MIMLTPETNEDYTVRIQDKETPIKVTLYSVTLQLTQNHDKIIYSTLSDKAITKASNIKLEIYTGNELLHSTNIDDSNASGYFDTSKLPNTVLSFILTKDDSIQIAQRAVFIDKMEEVEKLLLSKSIENSTNTVNLKGDFSNIDPEQSYRVYMNTFIPLLTDLLPLSTMQTSQLSDCFDTQLPAAKRHYIIDLFMIQESNRLTIEFKNIYVNGYSNELRGKVKKEVSGTVDEGKIIAINAHNRDLSEAPLCKGGLFNINLGEFSDSTSYYLQAYNKKEKSNFFVIEADSTYKPSFVPTHGKLKKTTNTFITRQNIKDIAFEDVIPEVKVTARKIEKPIEAAVFYEGKTFTAEKIEERVFSSLEQIINSMTDVYVGSIPIDEREETFKKVIFTNKTKSGWREQLAPSQGIKFYPKGFSEHTERASWHKPDNQCIVVTGKELLDGTIIATTDPIESIFVEGFDKSGKIIQQRITLND